MVWNFLKLGNGGLITHIDLHADGTMVCTADSFGAYVWPPGGSAWIQLLNTNIISGLPQEGGGCDDIKIDPSNSNNIWLSYSGNFYKSVNRGSTFTQLSGYTVAALYANNGSPSKVFGPFIAIDPNNSNIVYISTPAQGVQRTLDGGATWATIAATNSGFSPYIFNTPALVVQTTSTTSNSIGTGAKNFTTAAAMPYNAGYSYVKVWQTSNPANNMYGLLSGSNPNYTVTVPANSAFGSGSGITDWSFGPFIDGNVGNRVHGGHCTVFDVSASTISTGSGSFSGLFRTKNIYVATYGIGVYFSNDGGQTFSLLSTTGMPKAVRRMQITPGGVLWLADDMYGSFSNVSKYASGAWTVNIVANPASISWYTSLAIDPSNPNRVVYVHADQPTISVFDGTSWISAAGSRAKRPVVATGDVEWLADMYTNSDGFANCDAKFDPNVANKVWTGAEGVWYFTCPTVNAASVTFTQQTRGIEEFIGNNVMSVPGDSGAVLLSTWDIAVFKTNTFNVYPTTPSGVEGNTQPGLMRGYSFDYLWSDPSKVVAIIEDGSGRDKSGYSTSYGNVGTWTEFATKPNTQGSGAHIAIADTNTIVWVSDGTQLPDGSNAPPKETTNNGASWSTISIPGGTPLYGWMPNGNASTSSKAAESDKTNGDIYVFNVNTGATSANPNASAIYKRTKATGAWSIVKSPYDFIGEVSFNGKFRSLPGSYGLTGHMWLTGGNGAPPHPVAGRPLYYTVDGWSHSLTVANFTECSAIGFGASFPGHSSYPTIFVAGWLSGVYGVWRCKDFNTGTGVGTWEKLGGTYPMDIVGVVSDLDGDKIIPGQVYIQTQASGAFYWTEDVVTTAPTLFRMGAR